MPTQAQDASDEEAAELSDLVGTVLAERYRIDEMLGEGGMGVVFRAHHLMLKRDVAIKLLHLELSSNPQLSARFDREAQSAARLEHPNIVHVSEFGSTDSGMKYMVMQLLEGCELEQLVGHGIPVDPERAVSLAIQIFRGLDHAHKHGVVHRDLKPENVFVTQDHEARETLKIVDFGIAKIVASEDEQDAGTAKPLTRHGLVFGTPEYMSPEQATGVEVDARTDLYSAGVILYEMLAGHRPFDSEDKIALIRMQVASDAPAFERDLPEPLANLVFELLSKEREGRPDTAAQVLQRLEAMQHTEATVGSSAVMRAHTRPPRDEGTTAVALPRGAKPLPSAGPSAWERWRRPLVAAVVTGTVFALVATWLDKSDEQADAALAASGEPEQLDAAAAASALNEASFAVIDRELLAKHGDAALDLVKPLKDQNPDDPQLLWREGQALALAKANKDSLALAAYAEALEKDPKLLDDAHFYAELYDLLRKRKLRDQALDFALQRLGEQGHKFLLELVNERNPSRALDFADRHRALSALTGHPTSGPLIDRRINLARDLWQSSRGRSPMPCRDFRQALADISAVNNVYFEPGVGRAKVPKPGKDEGELACEGAQAELEVLREALAKLKAESAEGGESGESDEGSAD